MGLANVADMHPSHYPFIVNGPDCSCVHRRLAHVGTNRYGMPAADQGCSECQLCERYTPLEAIDRAAEELQREEILANRARRSERHRKITAGQLVALLLAIPLVIINPDAFTWLLYAVIALGVANMETMALASWRVGDLETSELVMQLGMGVGVLGFFLAMFAGAPLIAYGLLGMVLLCGFCVGWVNQRWLKRSMRSMDALVTDLKKQQDDQP